VTAVFVDRSILAVVGDAAAPAPEAETSAVAATIAPPKLSIHLKCTSPPFLARPVV